MQLLSNSVSAFVPCSLQFSPITTKLQEFSNTFEASVKSLQAYPCDFHREFGRKLHQKSHMNGPLRDVSPTISPFLRARRKKHLLRQQNVSETVQKHFCCSDAKSFSATNVSCAGAQTGNNRETPQQCFVVCVGLYSQSNYMFLYYLLFWVTETIWSYWGANQQNSFLNSRIKSKSTWQHVARESTWTQVHGFEQAWRHI